MNYVKLTMKVLKQLAPHVCSVSFADNSPLSDPRAKLDVRRDGAALTLSDGSVWLLLLDATDTHRAAYADLKLDWTPYMDAQGYLRCAAFHLLNADGSSAVYSVKVAIMQLMPHAMSLDSVEAILRGDTCCVARLSASAVQEVYPASNLDACENWLRAHEAALRKGMQERLPLIIRDVGESVARPSCGTIASQNVGACEFPVPHDVLIAALSEAADCKPDTVGIVRPEVWTVDDFKVLYVTPNGVVLERSDSTLWHAAWTRDNGVKCQLL